MNTHGFGQLTTLNPSPTGTVTTPGGSTAQPTSGPIFDGSAVAALSVVQTNPDQSACAANPAISTFQQSYNTAYGTALQVDGKYGAATDTALRTVLGSSFPSGLTPVLCGSSAAPSPSPSPSPSPAPVNVNVTPAPATSSNTALYVGGAIVAAVAVGGILYARERAKRGAPILPSPRRSIRRRR